MSRSRAKGPDYGEYAAYLARNGADNSTGYTRLLRDLTLAMQEDLTPRQRELTKLYYLEGMPMTQIAQRLDVSVSTVSRTLARARRRLYHCMRFGAEDLLRR
ncbi:MAG: sigma-70 family RNA polymerase sigma factor [Oscillospiraceae bacterium]|nr:sigma-70 family RNA polymerase sigma factor [Oscillospiraceae bacterium]